MDLCPRDLPERVCISPVPGRRGQTSAGQATHSCTTCTAVSGSARVSVQAPARFGPGCDADAVTLLTAAAPGTEKVKDSHIQSVNQERKSGGRG